MKLSTLSGGIKDAQNILRAKKRYNVLGLSIIHRMYFFLNKLFQT